MAFYTLKGAEMGVLQAAWIEFKDSIFPHHLTHHRHSCPSTKHENLSR